MIKFFVKLLQIKTLYFKKNTIIALLLTKYIIMKKILFILFAFCFSFSNIAYASFPITNSAPQSEVAVDEMNASTLTSAASGTIFKFGPFIVGLLFGLIGVGLVYIFTDDKDSRRSAWYGLGTWLILFLLLVSAAGA